MAYQVTMDRTLSESEIDRLVQSELSRRKYNTRFTEESNEEFVTEWKASLKKVQDNFPSGRFRNIRWQDQSTGDASVGNAKINPDDPLGLEAHPTENTCPIIFTSFCHPCNSTINEGDGALVSPKYWWGCSESITEQLENDWKINGGSGDFRDKLGLTNHAMWNDNPATGETSADILNRWKLLPHEKGFASDPTKISMVPLIQFFKSIGVSHHGHFIVGQKPKEVTEMLEVGTENKKGIKTINGKDRREAPSDFPWPWQYGMSDVTGNENIFVLSGYLNCEDAIVNGLEIIQDYGWPGTK